MNRGQLCRPYETMLEIKADLPLSLSLSQLAEFNSELQLERNKY